MRPVQRSASRQAGSFTLLQYRDREISTYEGYGVTAQAQQCVIHATQSSWEERSRGFNTTLLWRTPHDTDSVQRASGSVLCLGEPHHETARALLFQNFEGSLQRVNMSRLPTTRMRLNFKGDSSYLQRFDWRSGHPIRMWLIR